MKKDRLQELALHIKESLPKDHGFVLLAFDFEENSRLNYISNCDRDDVVEAMVEFIRVTKGQWGTHQVGVRHSDTDDGC